MGEGVFDQDFIKDSLTFIAKASVLLGVVGLCTGAFTSGVRMQILERDGYRCKLCGATDHLEAAHINHNKSRYDYNSPSNGRTLCIKHHLMDHINRHGRNGLPKRQNEWAIEQLRSRLPEP